MDIITLGIIIVVIMTVAMILVRVFFKNLFRIISIIWLIMFVVMVVFGLLIYADAVEMKEKMAEMPSLFLLQQDGRIRAGFSVMGEEPELIEKPRSFQQSYNDQEYDSILGSTYYKVFIFDFSIFNDTETLDIDEFSIPIETVSDIIRANSSNDVFTEYIMGDGNAVGMNFDEIGTDANLRNILFVTLFGKKVEEKGPAFLLEGIKQEEIEVQKESIIFKTIKYFPSSILQKAMEKVAKIQGVETNGTS